MTFKEAVKVLSSRVWMNLTDEQDKLYHEAAQAIQDATKLPDESYDWILDGDYNGNETPSQIISDWNE